MIIVWVANLGCHRVVGWSLWLLCLLHLLWGRHGHGGGLTRSRSRDGGHVLSVGGSAKAIATCSLDIQHVVVVVVVVVSLRRWRVCIWNIKIHAAADRAVVFLSFVLLCFALFVVEV